MRAHAAFVPPARRFARAFASFRRACVGRIAGAIALASLVSFVAGCRRSLPAGAEAGTTEVTAAESDASMGTVVESAPADAAAPPLVYVFGFVTPVFSAPEWPAQDPTKAAEERKGVYRLGYLRWGAQVAYKRRLKKGNCAEDWFELASGGFICGKYATSDANHPELKKVASPPNPDEPLPYHYGLNLSNGTPLYRRRPLRKERQEVERGLQVGKTKKKPQASDGKSGEPAQEAADTQESPPPTTPDGETPWYLKKHGGERPMVKFDELKGDGLVVLRMVRGFYLGLDKEVSSFSGRFWRTTQGFFVPRDHLLVHKPKREFQGVELDGGDHKLPIGFIVSPNARKYTVAFEKKVKRHDKIDRFTLVPLTGKRITLEGRSYWESTEGYWMRDLDGNVARPTSPPKDLAPGEKWIDVDISNETLVAFEGDKPVFATLISSGRRNKDPEKDHRTVTGSFRIREKHVAATMEDDGASDGPYSIQDVPWIMYFEKSYALHGAFWHSNWGRERSHGCVNLAPVDAKRVFHWAGPNLPEGWHGVRATGENPGTRVVVHE